MKKYLLTDFNTDRWKGVDFENIKSHLISLNEKISQLGFIYGEIGNPTTFSTLLKPTHTIKNLTFNNGKVYGDVEFLNNDNGKEAQYLIENNNCKFGIRSIGTSEQYKGGKIEIKQIFTWDIIEKQKS